MKQVFRQVKPDKATNSALLPTGMQVDLGGIAKGWIAERAAQQLAKVSCACAVNAGGDIGHATGRMVKMMKQMNRDHQEQDWDWPLLDGSLRHTMEKSE